MAPLHLLNNQSILLAIVSLTVINSVARRQILIEAATPPFRTSTSTPAFAGFGATKTSALVGKKKKRSKPSVPEPPLPDLSTAEGRMAHIASCIEQADISAMGAHHGEEWNSNAICSVDNFLGGPLIQALRTEAESLLPIMLPSQSTRWEEETQSVITYDKEGVLSTQIEGGTESYNATPRLVEYVVTLTHKLAEKINAIVPPEYQLSGTQQTNKLAVCIGNGSKYDKHIDNLGGGDEMGDQRKMTALLYLQPSGSHEFSADNTEVDPRGGYFRAYDVPEDGNVKVFAPRGDRLLLFWSDSLVHDVSPSFAPNAEIDWRWALTIWFVVKLGGNIRVTGGEVVRRHFGTGKSRP